MFYRIERFNEKWGFNEKYNETDYWLFFSTNKWNTGPPPLLLRKNTRTKSVYKVITSTSVK